MICLEKSTLKQVLAYCKLASGKTVGEISEETGLTHSSCQRYFNEFDMYYPRIIHLPVICKALGTTLPLEWLARQVGCTVVPLKKGEAGRADFMASLSAMCREYGEAVSAVARALEDGKVTREEAEECLAELEDVEREIARLKEMLRREEE